MKHYFAQQILKNNKEIWNKIARDFSHTRNYNWPELLPLSKYAKKNMRILDLGCGNGRLYELFKGKKIKYVGVDFSKKLTSIAKKKYPKAKFLAANALNLPLKDNSFDIIYSIAVLHTIPSRALRLKFLHEARRVLKKDGLLILTVWNLWQRKYLKILVKYSLLKLLGKSKLDWCDLYVPWQNRYQRYYHAFRKKELKGLLKDTGFATKSIKYLERKNKKVNILIIAYLDNNKNM